MDEVLRFWLRGERLTEEEALQKYVKITSEQNGMSEWLLPSEVNQQVYVYPRGVYHFKVSCSTLRGSQVLMAMTRADAIRQGRPGCIMCDPRGRFRRARSF